MKKIWSYLRSMYLQNNRVVRLPVGKRVQLILVFNWFWRLKLRITTVAIFEVAHLGHLADNYLIGKYKSNSGRTKHPELQRYLDSFRSKKNFNLGTERKRFFILLQTHKLLFKLREIIGVSLHRKSCRSLPLRHISRKN